MQDGDDNQTKRQQLQRPHDSFSPDIITEPDKQYNTGYPTSTGTEANELPKPTHNILTSHPAPPHTIDRSLPTNFHLKLQAVSNSMNAIKNLLDREVILQEALIKTSSRIDLLLIHVVQDDVSFNSKQNSDDKSSFKYYTLKQRDRILDCITTLHEKYYGVKITHSQPNTNTSAISKPGRINRAISCKAL